MAGKPLEAATGAAKMKLTSIKAIPLRAHDAWWYDERGAINVFIRPNDSSDAVSCKIRRADLVKFIERSKPRGRK